VLYADPPWQYEHPISNSRKIENQYSTMSLESIKQMNISIAKDAVLYLWATAPKLTEALSVMDSWGFAYRSCAIWDKGMIGMGYWFRIQHELLLVGVRGKKSPPKPEQRVSSILCVKRGQHSSKPDQVRHMISTWYPNERKLELFAREAHEGWDSFGNQVESTLFAYSKP